jgi:hypothetical protein
MAMADENIVWQRSSTESSSNFYDQSVIMEELQINDHFQIDKDYFKNSLNQNNNNNNNGKVEDNESPYIKDCESNKTEKFKLSDIFCFKFFKSDKSIKETSVSEENLKSTQNTNNNNNQSTIIEPFRERTPKAFCISDFEEKKLDQLETSFEINHSRKLIKVDDKEKKELCNDLFDWNASTDDYFADDDESGRDTSMRKVNFKILNKTRSSSNITRTRSTLVKHSLSVYSLRQQAKAPSLSLNQNNGDIKTQFKSQQNEMNYSSSSD